MGEGDEAGLSVARPKSLNPGEKTHISLRGDLKLRLDLYLTQPATGKVPLGAYSKFFNARVEEFFARIEQAAKGNDGDAGNSSEG